MEVTKKNFGAVLPEVLAEIEQCSLIAFDTEFTGLHDGLHEDWTDQPQDRYSKLRMCSGRFCLVQFGLCLFIQAEASPLKYTVKPYNFYIFPSSPYKDLDRRFLCQASCLVFLGAHNTDFNKWIKEGIPFLSEGEECWWHGRNKEPSQEEVNLQLGFSQVIMAITRSGKPLVGHNCMLDFIHTYTHFIGALPESLQQFKAELSKRFSHVYDSKVVSQHRDLEVRGGASPRQACLRKSLGMRLHVCVPYQWPLLGPPQSLFLSGGLTDVYSRVRHPPFPPLSLTLPPTCTQYTSTAACHEASYDAFITGYSLIAMATYLANSASDDPLVSVRSLENRIFLAYVDGINYTCLTAPDPPLPRDHVFFMTFSEDFTTDDIRNLFSPFGGARVCWLGSTSAHVLMNRRKRAKEAYKSLVSRGAIAGKHFTITPFTPSPSPLSPHTPTSSTLSPHTPTSSTLSSSSSTSPHTPSPSTIPGPPTDSGKGRGCGPGRAQKRPTPHKGKASSDCLTKRPAQFQLCDKW